MSLVKVCPVCEARNDASAQRCKSCQAMLIGVDLTESQAPEAPSASAAPGRDAPAQPAPASPAAASPRCPHADCGQLNPDGAERCIYCNRPMQGADAQSAPPVRAALRWPWGEQSAIEGPMLIGREDPAPPALAARLERQHSNVSRRHAELELVGGELWVADLGSSNGTFVNDTRLPPGRRVRLANGARLRFAADLSAVVEIHDGRD